MTTFLWTVVILMAAALVAEIAAFIGMAIVGMRAARRAAEITQQLKQRIEPSVQLAKELQQSLQPRVEAIGIQSKEIEALVTHRRDTIQAAFVDTSRRVERLSLRFNEGVETVEGQQQRRGIYRDVVEPLQTAHQVVRGLKLALWLLRKVA